MWSIDTVLGHEDPLPLAVRLLAIARYLGEHGIHDVTVCDSCVFARECGADPGEPAEEIRTMTEARNWLGY